jgi:hypothetical protein
MEMLCLILLCEKGPGGGRDPLGLFWWDSFVSTESVGETPEPKLEEEEETFRSAGNIVAGQM